jgi:hypothetical protein
MVKLRDLVLASRRFVDEATIIFRELQLGTGQNAGKRIRQKKGKKKSAISAAQKTGITINTNANKRIDTAIIVVPPIKACVAVTIPKSSEAGKHYRKTRGSRLFCDRP